MLNLLRYEVLSRWKGILGWGIGLALFGSMYIAIFPEMGEQMAGLADLSLYQMMGIDLGSFGGFVASVVVQYIPLILGIYAVLAGTGTLAGEEDRGTLEIIMAMPLSRWQIISIKALALAIASFLIVAIAGIGDVITLTIVKNMVEVNLTPMELFIAVLSTWPLTFAFIMIGLFAGAILPSRGFAVAVTAVIFIASYFGRMLVSMVDSLDFIEPLLLFTYLDTTTTAFTEGPEASDVAVLLAVALVFFVLAVISFQQRNITVGSWPWQRVKLSS